jgi:hypothetical protein
LPLRHLRLVFFGVFFPALLVAQTPSAPVAQAKSGQQVFQVEDGGVRGTLESIVIPPKTDSPFTLVLATEWIQTMADGGSITLVNQRKIARDSKGRIFQERWFLVPKNGKAESKMTAIQIADPHSHILYSCFMQDGRNACQMRAYTPSPNAIYKMTGPPPGPLPDNAGIVIHEDLGHQSFFGIETDGTRDSTIYNPNVFGNDHKVVVEREFWYSPQLGINLLSKRSDPRFGSQNFTALSVDTSEPDPKLFDFPEGFKMVDMRDTSPPESE